MERIRIRGGAPLQGEVTVQGSKNAALPMMAAALLHKGTTVLEGCPRIRDVECMEEILKAMGASTRWEGDCLVLDCRDAFLPRVGGEYARKMRSSIVVLGALVGRFGQGEMGYPGGCVIGKRPIDLHLEVLKALGAEIQEGQEEILAKGCLRGGHIVFPKVSVGATEQGMLSAVLADGETVLSRCAREPEICHLQEMLRGMGAEISGAGTDTIRIHGGRNLRDSRFRVPPDRIVAGTYLCAGAITRGTVALHRCPFGELTAFLSLYRKMGGQFAYSGGTLVADSHGICHSLRRVETAAYPGFPTDLQSPLMAVLATVPGESHLVERIFEDRYKVVRELNRLGARVQVRCRDAWILGGGPLRGTKVRALELRGGAALVLAGLAARGETLVEGCAYIHRGYEDICRDVSALGGELEII